MLNVNTSLLQTKFTITIVNYFLFLYELLKDNFISVRPNGFLFVMLNISDLKVGK